MYNRMNDELTTRKVKGFMGYMLSDDLIFLQRWMLWEIMLSREQLRDWFNLVCVHLLSFV